MPCACGCAGVALTIAQVAPGAITIGPKLIAKLGPWRAAVTQNNKGVLLETKLVQVGVKQEFRGSQGRIQFFVGNKSPVSEHGWLFDARTRLRTPCDFDARIARVAARIARAGLTRSKGRLRPPPQ